MYWWVWLAYNAFHLRHILCVFSRMAPKSSKEFDFIAKNYFNFLLVGYCALTSPSCAPTNPPEGAPSLHPPGVGLQGQGGRLQDGGKSCSLASYWICFLLQGDWYTMMRDSLLLTGDPQCYLSMNTGKVRARSGWLMIMMVVSVPDVMKRSTASVWGQDTSDQEEGSGSAHIC